MNTLIISLITGISIFFIVILIGQDDKNLDPSTNRRLLNIKNKVDSSNKSKIKNNIKTLINDTEYKVLILGTILEKIKFTGYIKRMLKIADIKTTVDVFLMISIALASPFLLIALINPEKSLFFIIIGTILGYLPFIMVKMKIKKKLTMFTQQFPDALGMISSSLRAGHSLLSSFQIVVHEMPYPVNFIFKTVVDDISLGRDTRDSLESMSNQLPDSIDLRFFITAVLIQREIGGNLAEILDNLNYTIRERFKLIGQLNTQTAQAKMSGLVLAVAPAVIGFLIWIMNPAYMDPLFKTFIGQLSLGMAFFMAFTGFLIINKITAIRV